MAAVLYLLLPPLSPIICFFLLSMGFAHYLDNARGATVVWLTKAMVGSFSRGGEAIILTVAMRMFIFADIHLSYYVKTVYVSLLYW